MESLALFLACYATANAMLAPLALLYFWLDPRRAPLALLLRLHRSLLLATLVLPALLFAWNLLGELAPPGSAAAGSAAGVLGSVASGLLTRDALAAPLDLEGFSLSARDWLFYALDSLSWLLAAGVPLFALRWFRQASYLRELRTGARCERRDGYELVLSSAVRSPFSAGWIRPRIYLPAALPSGQAELILAHELNHLRLGHHAWALLEASLQHLFWFNPLLHGLRRRGELYRELECDERTAAGRDRHEYARLLLACAELAVARRPVALGGHAWALRHALRARVEHLLEGRPSASRWLRAALLLGLGASGLLLWLSAGVGDRLLEEQLLWSIREQHARDLARGSPVELAQVPEHFIRALLISEDRTFYEHAGVRLASLLRAAGSNLWSTQAGEPGRLAGGSTLSMQLGRSFLLRRERSIERKLRELKITRVLERNFSKQQILQMYLNRVYFGEQAWGLGQAALTYFGHPYTALSREESAMLVPFLRAPSLHNVRVDPAGARANQQALLARMAE